MNDQTFQPTITIVGGGVVGRKIKEIFPYASIYDIEPGKSEVESLPRSSFYFICVPTPLSDVLSCECVEGYLRVIEDGTIIVKSTLSFDFLKNYAGRDFIYSPEFTGSTAMSYGGDFVILSGAEKEVAKARDLFRFGTSKRLRVFECEMSEACLIKYAENSFLAMKVTFFNQLFALCSKLGCSFEKVRDVLCQDKRIGDSHSYFFYAHPGFLSKCLLKDVPSFCSEAKTIMKGIPFDFLLDHVLEINEDIVATNCYSLFDGKQKDIAKLLGVSESCVSRWAHATGRRPSKAIRRHLSRVASRYKGRGDL